jgi:hypothetical protein
MIDVICRYWNVTTAEAEGIYTRILSYGYKMSCILPESNTFYDVSQTKELFVAMNDNKLDCVDWLIQLK